MGALTRLGALCRQYLLRDWECRSRERRRLLLVAVVVYLQPLVDLTYPAHKGSVAERALSIMLVVQTFMTQRVWPYCLKIHLLNLLTRKCVMTFLTNLTGCP